MTLTLLLIRHAKSDWGTAATGDHDRPLGDRGRRDAPRMAAWVAAQGLAPLEVLCSDARRTRETLELMRPEWAPSPSVVHDPSLYHATPEAMLEAIGRATAPRVAVVAHNPGTCALAHRLARRAPKHGRWDDFPTCAVAALAFEAEGWDAIREGRGEVVAFAVPADLGG